MEGIWGVSLQAKMLHITHQKIESSCPLVIEHILEKKVSLIALDKFYQKFCRKHPFYTVMTYLEKLVGTKSLNTKQCPAVLSPRIIPNYLHRNLWETLAMGKNPPNSQIFTHIPHQKNPP